MPYTTAAALSIALVAVRASRQPVSCWAVGVIIVAISALAAGALVGAVGQQHAARWTSAEGVTCWVLAFQLGILLTPAVVAALVIHIAADERVWTWPYLNKRWLVSLYSLIVATTFVFPAALARWRDGGEARVDARATGPEAAGAGRTGRRWPVAGVVVIVLLAWWFAGPPWHLDRYRRSIDSHEQAHLAALQAIDKGYLPYVGPASTQYGPGSQLVMYRIMKLAGHFDIVSFRTAWAVFDFSALLIVALCAYAWLGLAGATAALAVAALYSPFAFYGTAADGTFDGFYGWGNALRYLSPVIVVPTLALTSTQARPRTSSARVLALGAAWGAASWLSQENLSSTLIATALLLILLCCTRTITVARAARILRDLAIGFAVVAAPILLFYARHGALAEFVRNYFAVPQAVAAGFSNTWWPAHESARRTFYGAAPFVLGVGLLTLWRRPWPTLQSPLDRRRALVIAFVSVQLVCYQVSLLRSDAGHLQNTMIAAPFILVLAFQELPAWLAGTIARRRAVALALLVAVLAIFPAGRLLKWRQILLTPAVRFLPAETASNGPAGDPPVAYARSTRALVDLPVAFSGSDLSMPTFLAFAADVQRIVGSRKTYVGEYSEVWTGPLFFFADLTPAPYPLDRDTMTINDQLRARVVEHIRNHPGDYECYIGRSLDDPEARAFLAAHRDARRHAVQLGAQTVHILLAPPGKPS